LRWNGGASPHLDGRLVALRGRDIVGAHPVFNLLGHGQKSLFYIGRVLGRGFEERNLQAVGKLFGDGIFNHLLARQIALVADEKLVDPLAGVPVDLLEPLFDVRIGVAVRDVVDNDDAVSAAVVRRRNCAKAFLTGSVPNLKLDCLALELDRADFKVHANGRNIALGVGVVRETKKQTTLSDARVTNEKELEEIVVLRVHV